ncbi:MAG: DUF6279 family lipoprotein [Hydrogenophaga sp.]|uniref:DUF6279 family lipoprotein n=1 Tax=Hydrogenophaga sp. TaxID=1904254 RepID=UPI0027608A74|nr:DUF6279 family lipoprotein [Hydrogenophaga sp.]MDP2416159.1 DUF6279 family lipoprotein [Hydrogenophaga sp.]MDZ4190088.1 DUF6279 family lipoprotein [Hydrogenophaga sp.]
MIDTKIIARRFGLALMLLTALTLSACSTTRLAYNQAPNLLYWWLDGYMDFTSEQSPQARQDIDTFLAWHRSNELTTYARQLQEWQAMATQDMSATQACAQFEAVRAAVQRASERGLEPLTRLGQQLNPAQVAHLQRHHDKRNDSFEKEYLRGSPEERLNRRVDQAVSRSETLYGRLSPAQRELVRKGLQQSPWDPQTALRERLRRQSELLQTLQTLQNSSNVNALNASRSHLTRVLQTPTAGYNANSQALVQHGCAQFAALHNTTTAEQRANAVRVLKGYEDDMRALAAQR